MNKLTTIWLSILSAVMLVLITVLITVGCTNHPTMKQEGREKNTMQTEQRQGRGMMKNQAEQMSVNGTTTTTTAVPTK